MPKERQLTRQFFKGEISLGEYHAALKVVATKRHAREIAKRKFRSDMSSTGWRN